MRKPQCSYRSRHRGRRQGVQIVDVAIRFLRGCDVVVRSFGLLPELRAVDFDLLAIHLCIDFQSVGGRPKRGQPVARHMGVVGVLDLAIAASDGGIDIATTAFAPQDCAQREFVLDDRNIEDPRSLESRIYRPGVWRTRRRDCRRASRDPEPGSRLATVPAMEPAPKSVPCGPFRISTRTRS